MIENNNGVNASNSVINVLVSNNRSELAKMFGVGLYISDGDTPNKVIEKCNSFIERYNNYIHNLEEVTKSGEALASEMKKAKVASLFNTLSVSERAELKTLLNA